MLLILTPGGAAASPLPHIMLSAAHLALGFLLLLFFFLAFTFTVFVLLTLSDEWRKSRTARHNACFLDLVVYAAKLLMYAVWLAGKMNVAMVFYILGDIMLSLRLNKCYGYLLRYSVHHLVLPDLTEPPRLVVQDTQGRKSIAVAIDYNLKKRGYGTFHRELRALLAVNPTEKHVLGMPVLAVQRKGEPPARWIHINLVGSNRWKHRTTIAMRDDNLCLVGFKNNSGGWFVFKGCRGEFPAKVSASASELPFGGGYRDLVGGHTNLVNYDMDKQSALDAIRLLAEYRGDNDNYDDLNVNERLKVALAQLCVMLAEGARFRSIFSTLHEKWDPEEASRDQQAMERAKKAQEATGITEEHGEEHIKIDTQQDTRIIAASTSGIRDRRPTETNKEERQGPTPTCRISANQANEVVQWEFISLSLLEWDDIYKRRFWPRHKQLEDLGITRPSHALDRLNLLLWPDGFYFDSLLKQLTRLIMFRVQQAEEAPAPRKPSGREYWWH